MHALRSILPVLGATLCVATGQAQVTYDGNTGGLLMGIGDDSVTTVTLGFAFAFPDGTTTERIDIDSNGRVFPAGADTSDFSESASEFLAETTSLCLCWDDLSPQNGGGIRFSTTATKAVITFENCRSFGSTVEYSMQCQLFADGRFGFLYDGRLRVDEEPLIGASEGNGAVDPGSRDLSTLTGTAGVTTVYEDFFLNTVDLQDTALEFTPDGLGGWNIVSGAAGFPPPPIAGSTEIVSDPADSTIDFVPDGLGGYTVTRSVGAWFDDSVVGTSVGTALPDDGLTGPLGLGFSFAFPGGVTTTSVFADNNGRILVSDPGTMGDFDPSVRELLGEPPSTVTEEPAPASICAFWCDLSAQFGDLRFSTDNVGLASVTWEDVPQFGETNALSFQILLRADGTFTLNYRGIAGWRTGFGAPEDDVLIGCSPGNSLGPPAVDPGASDFATTTIATAGDPTVYEFWDASVRAQPDVQRVLVSLITPALGGDLIVGLEGITTSSTANALLLGFTNPDVPLDAISMSGGTLSSDAVVQIPLSTVGTAATYCLPLPLDPSLVGLLQFFMQTASITAPPETGFVGVVLSNGLRVFF